MVAATRPGTPGDDVLGVRPGLVVEPQTVPEASEALAACARDRLRVVFAGGGTDLELGGPPAGLDVLLRTTRLARVVEHAPSDQIVVVEAGLTLAELQRQLAPHGQRLALDPPLAERATVGGVVAANAYGPRRHRFGTSRDLVVGMTFVRADGAVAKGGGKVVKNVAGFDLPRLLVGSLGTLALVATVTFRLHPLPESEATLAVRGLDAAGVRALARALRAAQLEPSSVVAFVEGGDATLAVRFEGFGPGVAEQLRRAAAAAEAMGHGAEALDDAAAREVWARHDRVRTLGTLRARIAAPPSALEVIAGQAIAPLAATLRGGAAVLYPTLGLGFVSGDAAGDGAAAAVSAARTALADAGGTLVLTAAPAEVRAAVDVWGPPPPALGVMRRVKRELDPDGRLAPGRFAGGF